MRHHEPMSVWAIVVAAGSAERFGGPKQLMFVAGQRVVDRSVAAAAASCDGVVVVVPAGTSWGIPDAIAVAGGATRSESVRAGLTVVPADAAIIVVHDAARPLADGSLFDAVIDAVRDGADGAVPGLAIADTVKEVRGEVVVATVPREMLVTVQTPQAFRAPILRSAHAAGAEGTDDAAVVEATGARVVVVAGRSENVKITTPEDLARAELWLTDQQRAR